MKSVLGLVQIGLGIAGIVALFNGEWLLMIGAWAGAMAVGFIGNRLVRATSGISEGGQQAITKVSRTLDLLREGQYGNASGLARSAVNDFKLGGDKAFLPFALTYYAVTQAALRDMPGAQKTLAAASASLSKLPPPLAAEAAHLHEVLAMVQREVSSGVPDPDALVAEILAHDSL